MTLLAWCRKGNMHTSEECVKFLDCHKENVSSHFQQMFLLFEKFSCLDKIVFLSEHTI